jgi:hypothetical protein
MKDEKKTKKELISELADLRRRLSELEGLKQDFEQANQRLRESEERFRCLVERSPYGIGVASDGVGLPDTVDVACGLSLGLSLVNTLVKQLKGELEVRRLQGTQFRIKFKEIKPAERRVS